MIGETMNLKGKKKPKHEHCWHKISNVLITKEPYSNPMTHWIEKCCECPEFRKEIDFL